eukprot:GSA25T00018697001.1
MLSSTCLMLANRIVLLLVAGGKLRLPPVCELDKAEAALSVAPKKRNFF